MATGGGGEDEGLGMLLKEFEIWQETTANDKEIFLLQVLSNWSNSNQAIARLLLTLQRHFV